MDRADPRWAELAGGYRLPYDPRPALDRLTTDAATAWAELWQELYHQGDVGEASYAAVPELVKLHRPGDWNTYAIAASIEEARREPHNPPVPAWLLQAYDHAWRQLLAMALAELPEAGGSELIDSLFATLAFAKGQPALGHIAFLSEGERAALLDGLAGP